MRLVVQRVKQASLSINNKTYSTIPEGLLVLLGVAQEDASEDIDWLVNKLVNLRIFSDAEGKMNLSVLDIKGEVMLISQFTLFASTKKGTRPSFTKSAKPEFAIPLYEEFIQKTENLLGDSLVKTGQFGADMSINLTNDGPVTITIDSKNRE